MDLMENAMILNLSSEMCSTLKKNVSQLKYGSLRVTHTQKAKIFL